MSHTQREKLEHNIIEKFSYFAKQNEAMECLSSERAVIINSRLASDMFNIVAKISVDTDTAFNEVLGYFRERQLPFALWLGFINEPAQLRDYLKNIQLPQVENEVGMVADLNNITAPRINQSLEVKPVKSLSQVEHIIEVMSALLPDEATVFEQCFHKVSHCLIAPNSKLTFFVGYLEGKAVATSSLYLDELSAGIWDIISIPAVRGQGVGTTMTYTTMLAAAKQGYSDVGLTASDDGFPIYEKIGFNVISRYDVYNFTA